MLLHLVTIPTNIQSVPISRKFAFPFPKQRFGTSKQNTVFPQSGPNRCFAREKANFLRKKFLRFWDGLDITSIHPAFIKVNSWYQLSLMKERKELYNQARSYLSTLHFFLPQTFCCVCHALFISASYISHSASFTLLHLYYTIM